MTESFVTVRSTDGLALEGAVAETDGPVGAAVLCHPHPRQGGTMNAPLMLDLRDRLLLERWAVVRFNFRGVGASEGESWDGTRETADAAGAVDLAKQKWPSLPLALIGWSFGAGVAVRHSIDRRPDACVAIAPPIRDRPGTSAGLPPSTRWPSEVPLLVVIGGRDHLVAAEDCRTWAEAAGARFHEIPAANHFFWARYDALGKAITDFLVDLVS